MEDRWEILEGLDRTSRDAGCAVLSTEHLDLVEVDGGHVIRVGRAPRPEFAGWRYGDWLPAIPERGVRHWLGRLFRPIPTSPLGYDVSLGGNIGRPVVPNNWVGSPFLEDAAGLTMVFQSVPLAPECPSCGRALAISPWSFHRVHLTLNGGAPVVMTTCGFCRHEVGVPALCARPGIRLGLSIVNARWREESLLRKAAATLDRADGPDGLLHGLAVGNVALGQAGPATRLALGIALDEQWEGELLEAEWRSAEEIAVLVDGELTEVPGFDEFRRRLLAGIP